MKAETKTTGFFVAPFVIDRKARGYSFQEIRELSEKWLTICGEHLDHYGVAFDVPWAGNLSHIRTKFTSDSGVALVTFSVRDRIVSSLLFASGRSTEVEADVTHAFVDSLRRIRQVQAAALDKPFEEVFTIKERPLMLVLPWPDLSVSAADIELVRELEVHLAGAFFARTKMKEAIVHIN